MELYDAALKTWQEWDICSVNDLELRLDSFRILFAYHSGKIENEEITYHDTREIFENGKVVGYTGDPRALFELQNQKVCYEALQEYDEEETVASLVSFLEEQTVKTWERVMKLVEVPEQKRNGFELSMM